MNDTPERDPARARKCVRLFGVRNHEGLANRETPDMKGKALCYRLPTANSSIQRKKDSLQINIAGQ
jgi:hypothetical protein